MAPGHLSVREMRDDEKPLVLEMLKVRRGPGGGGAAQRPPSAQAAASCGFS